MAHAEPREYAGTDCTGIHADCKVEAVGCIEAGLLVEVRGIARHGRATERLRTPYHATDLRSTEVGAFETIKVRDAAPVEVLLNFVRVLHHRDSLVGVEIWIGFFGGESQQRSFRVIDLLMSDQPPCCETTSVCALMVEAN